MNGKFLAFLVKIGLVRQESVYYIGGADVLPPPLKGTEEQAALMALEEGDENAKQLLMLFKFHHVRWNSPLFHFRNFFYYHN